MSNVRLFLPRTMKYKEIDAMLHNFGHSFVSLMNYVDDQYIADLLGSLAKQSDTREIAINFNDGSVHPALSYPPELAKSVSYWQAWLPKHMNNHRIDAQALSPVLLRYRLTNVGPEVIVESTDDRGKHHKVFVRG
jgi:hypothetical protein